MTDINFFDNVRGEDPLFFSNNYNGWTPIEERGPAVLWVKKNAGLSWYKVTESDVYFFKYGPLMKYMLKVDKPGAFYCSKIPPGKNVALGVYSNPALAWAYHERSFKEKFHEF